MKIFRALSLMFLLCCASALFAQAPTGFVKLNTSPVTTTSFSDANCADLTTCYYVVTAVLTGGQESVGAACASTQLCFNGNQAVAIMPSSGTHTNALSWTASTSSGATYNVYRLVPGAPSNLTAITN